VTGALHRRHLGRTHGRADSRTVNGTLSQKRKVQKFALTGRVGGPSDGGVPILQPDPDLIALRVTLARLRNDRGWTFDELAERSGLARRTVIDLEHGRGAGNVTTWHALAHAFDVPIGELLGALCGNHTPPGTQDA
jgi:putative transcriptional regulator